MDRPRRSASSLCTTTTGGGGAANAAVVSGDGNTGINDERVLILIYRSLNWDPHLLSVAACVSRRLRAVTKRVLWREHCFARAPRMVSSLLRSSSSSASAARIGGGWDALAKLLIFCCGRVPSPSVAGHFAAVSRFSKTSGRSFLARRCWGDLLYVSDPCEHPTAGGEDLGVYRGVFGGFMRSRTRACLVGRRADLEPRVRCPYCGARVWNMAAARLVPRSAARRLGSHEGEVEYFVCVNGHLHGNCWFAHLSSSDDDDDGGGGGEEDDDDGGDHVAC